MKMRSCLLAVVAVSSPLVAQSTHIVTQSANPGYVDSYTSWKEDQVRPGQVTNATVRPGNPYAATYSPSSSEVITQAGAAEAWRRYIASHPAPKAPQAAVSSTASPGTGAPIATGPGVPARLALDDDPGDLGVSDGVSDDAGVTRFSTTVVGRGVPRRERKPAEIPTLGFTGGFLRNLLDLTDTLAVGAKKGDRH